ncbi:putative RxLR effector [Phytophthora cinnamomi]|uniref:putative RxLR effector n=1 Tax=Phytophthora cinnamomi TaxID=4785 RepID=UPI00355A0A24|nr:putative RxLR effector [Phytophthora cinnamomi]
MRLTNAGDWLFYFDDFTRWLKYVDDLHSKNPAKGTSAIATLTAHYGDAKLYKLVDEATKITGTKELATELQTKQMNHWVAVAKDPDDVFHFMELDKVNEQILSNPKFTAWAKYVDDFSAKYPTKQVSMVPALLSNYDDVTLFGMAEAAMRVEGTKTVAIKLQDQLAKAWLNSGKSPGDAFVKLGLGEPVSNLLERPLFSSWLKYTNAYSEKYPHEKATAIETLTQKFGDKQVAQMLGMAKSKDSTRSIATNLESAQLEMWFRGEKSVNDVLVLLRLYSVGDFGGDSLLNTWVSYMNVFLKDNPGEVTSMLTKLETQFSDRPFHQILQAGMKFSSMESAATKIQAEKIQGYLASNQSPHKVFEWLNLDNVGIDLPGDPLFTTWMKYVKDFNKNNPKRQESVFTPIRESYNYHEEMINKAMNNPSTVKIAEQLEREQSKYWLDLRQLPENVFYFLKLDKADEKTLVNRNFKTWVEYLNQFNRRYPEAETTMIDGLRANYADINLLAIFNAAKKDPKTEKLAMNLESALVIKWVAEKEPLAVLKRRFNHVRFADELLEKYAEKVKTLSGATS